MGIWEISLRELIMAGGPIMIPIITCSVVALGIVIEKLISFSKIRTNPQSLKETVFQLLKSNRIPEAIRFCQEQNSPIAEIMKAGIMKAGETRETIKETMEDVSLFEVPRLEKRLMALSTIANISTLLGLLGTVTGMTGSFYTIQARSATMNPVSPGDLAGGIAEALITTVAGLTVAIPTTLAYNYLVSRVNALVLEMERAATELVNLLCHLQEAGQAAAFKNSDDNEV